MRGKYQKKRDARLANPTPANPMKQLAAILTMVDLKTLNLGSVYTDENFSEEGIEQIVKDYERSSATVRAIRAFGVIETMTEQELDEFYGSLTDDTTEDLSLIADVALSEASSYIAMYRADLVGDEDAMYLLADRLLDTCFDWFGQGSKDTPTRIADDFFAGEWRA